MVLDREFPPDIRVENEIEALSEAGFEVHIACFTKENKKKYEFSNNIHIHRKKISEIIFKTSVGCLKFPIYFNFWRSFIQGLFKKYNFKVIHIHDLPLAQIGYEFKSKYGVKFILDLHENWPAYLRMAAHTKSIFGKFLSNDSEWIRYESEMCNNADNIITVVDEARHRLVKAGVQGKKIAVVSNTLNLTHFSLPKIKQDPNIFTIVYAGGINKHRGLQNIIRGLQFIDKGAKKLQFIILGVGSYLNELKKISKNIGVYNMIDFIGWVPYVEMQKYILKSDLCVIPHEKNDHTDSTIPHKLFQYMFAGKPVISSNCNPITRILNECKCGYVYKFNDPNDFAVKVSEIYNNNELYIKMSKNGRACVENKYNWEKDKEYLLSIYKTI